MASDHGISGIMPLDTCPTLVLSVNSCLFDWEKMLTVQIFKIDFDPWERTINYSDLSLVLVKTFSLLSKGNWLTYQVLALEIRLQQTQC